VSDHGDRAGRRARKGGRPRSRRAAKALRAPSRQPHGPARAFRRSASHSRDAPAHREPLRQPRPRRSTGRYSAGAHREAHERRDARSPCRTPHPGSTGDVVFREYYGLRDDPYRWANLLHGAGPAAESRLGVPAPARGLAAARRG
jgi:hypothetical protein